ncbi:non-ribosomal peptide synthetase [Chitinophaga sancti]|uniref:Amino acid adenylation domain-containing protein n=1 Tax=Chitinophaga sancti TaxID=1004 RepID=A0A1K1QNE5_9BACT|nr:non-ribosomal peptide synthetase [Chitinophaga sancti]WQD65068.1 non-ribosomal peptide synthetase [Chitinophaga sancti]WQG89308.1 non-ribosomal peptide synthetase [Chitinophaga sancti]SFW61458.1 amino acid adenylation domain-containing protein [Chitinophaga sancti]
MKLTLPQQDIYYEQLMYPGLPIYNIGAKIEIRGPLQPDAMREAYECLIAQHDSFRGIVITTDNNEPAFQIQEKNEAVLGFVDFSLSDDAYVAANTYMQREFKKPFDLTAGRMLHTFCLVKVADDFHYLFSVYHHLITDGWGTSLMFQRLVKNYNEILATGHVQSEYPFTYRNYVDDDAIYQESPTMVSDKEYWMERFRALGETFIPRLNRAAYLPESRRQEWMVPRATYDKMNGLAKAWGVSAFHIIMGVLYTYFGRYYNCDDLAIGLPVLNRDKAIHKKTVGLFMGVSPLRMHLNWEDSFRQLAIAIKDQLRQDYRHQRFPLGRLIRELHLRQERERLFNITLSYERHDYADAFQDTITQVLPLTHEAERVALAVYIREFDQHRDVKFDFDYSLNYFNEASIRQLISHVAMLFDEVLQAPEKQLKTLSLLSPAEEEQVLYRFNKTDKSFFEANTLLDMIDAHATAYPDKIAIQDGYTSYSYKEMQDFSGGIAGVLQSEEAGPVAVIMERSALLPIVLLGIMKAGRPYIPLDPSFPQARLAHIIENSQAKVIIGEGGISPDALLQVARNTVPYKDELLGPEHAAYIIYTSGSTGTPKGVEIGHRSLLNFLRSMQVQPGLHAEDLLFSVTTYSFDISLLEFFLPLITGATVYIADKWVLSDPGHLITELEKVQPTIMQATPGFYQLLLNAGWQGAQRLKLLCGGDLLSVALAEKLLNAGKELWNMYGPTETTIWSSLKQVISGEDARNIGKPIDNTRFYVLDRWMNPLPVGAIGNLYIGGAGLAHGYYRNPTLTAARFVPDPFQPGARMYDTGDVGQWNEKGEILFLGRKDSQVKIRGFRIELGEIEKTIMLLEEVDEACVVAKKTDDQGAFLIAFVKAAAGIPAHLIAHLRATLPDYMIPGVVVPVSELPLTPNKKVDRTSLSQRDITAFISHRGDVIPPTTPVEKDLARLWEENLQVAVTDVRSDFFSLGGHSIKAAQLVNTIRQHFSVPIAIRDIFDHSNIRAQAAIIASARKDQYPLIPLAPQQAVYPITPAQHMIWLASQQEASNVAYNMSAVFDMTGAINIQVLETAFTLVIQRHEVLRSNFRELQGMPVQVVQAPDKYHFRLQQSDAALATAFDIENELLLKGWLVDNNGIQQLIFLTHHLIMDGPGFGILIREVAEVYNSQLQGKAPLLSPVRIQYKDYAVWIRQQLEEEALHMSRDYWIQQLGDFQPVQTFEWDGDTPSYKGGLLRFDLNDEHTSAIRRLANRMGITINQFLLASVQALVFRLTSQQDVCIGMPVGGRSHPELQELLGMFANTVVLRGKYNKAVTFEDVCMKAREQVLHALQHHDFPLSEIMKALHIQHMPFDMMVAFQDPGIDLGHIHAFDGFSLEEHPVSYTRSRLPLALNFFDKGDVIAFETIYDTGIYEAPTILLIMERYQRLLQGLVATPDKAIMEQDIALDIEKSMKPDNLNIEFHF